MKTGMKVTIAVAGALLLSALAGVAPRATAADPLVLGDVAWTVAPGSGEPRLRVKYRTSSSDVALDGTRAALAGARTALGGAAGPVDFSVAHAAGTLACTGALTRAFEGAGNCRFASDPEFERQLAARGLAPDRRTDMLAMLLVDATIALADGLIEAGVRPEESDDLIAAAALKVTPAYVRELRSGALSLTSVDDAIACKALGVDGAYVRGLAEAGYAGLDAGEVVGMKAMGVTPAYARAMNAAAKGGQ